MDFEFVRETTSPFTSTKPKVQRDEQHKSATTFVRAKSELPIDDRYNRAPTIIGGEDSDAPDVRCNSIPNDNIGLLKPEFTGDASP